MTDSITTTETTPSEYSVRAIVRASRLLQLISQFERGASLAELADASGLAKPSVYRIVRTLAEVGLVERVPSVDRYRIGVRCLELGQKYLDQLDVRSESLPVLERLRDETRETVHLAVLDDDLRVVYLEKLQTRQAVGVMMSRVGRTAPSHCTGIGKALLSLFRPDPVAELQRRAGLTRHTAATITDPTALRRELEEIDRLGYAVDLGEHEAGVACIACPIGLVDGRLVAISAAGPTHRLSEDVLRGQLLGHVRGAADEIARRLGVPVGTPNS